MYVLCTYYAKRDSIFAPFIRSDSVNYPVAFKKIVATGIQLAPLSEFAEYYRKLVFRQIFKAAMYCRFADGEDIAPYFSNNCPYDLDTLYKDSDILEGDGLLSVIATPSVNILKERVPLNSIDLEFSDLIKSLSIFSNALTISFKDNGLPGSSDVTLFSHIVSVEGGIPRPPTLILSDLAYDKIKSSTYCGEFYGGLRIVNTSGNKSLVVMNGMVFEIVDGYASITATLKTSPTKSLITQHLTDFQISLVASEARLNFLLSGNHDKEKAGLDLIHRYLLWFSSVVGPDESEDNEVVSLQARALYLAQLAAKPEASAVSVPFLKYDAYRDTVDSVQEVLKTANLQLTSFQKQIRERKAEERQIKRDKQLNENIIKTGKLITDYISAQAKYQDDMSSISSGLISDREKELDFLNSQAKDLSDKLRDQRETVNTAIEDYKESVQEWETKQMIKAALDIATNIFALGFSFASPASAISALEDLGLMVQRIQKAVNIFNALIKTYSSFKGIPSDPQKVVDILSGIVPKDLEMPTQLEWQEMKVNMDATLNSGPDVGAKNTLSAAFAILVLRGRALLDVQNQIQVKLTELSAAYSNKRIHDSQKNRLSAISAKFDVSPNDLDVEKIDLIGLSSQLVLFQRQMLMIMGSTLVIQDRALQYEYLQPPTSLGTFSFINLQLVILHQAQAITKGLIAQPTPASQPEPIVFEIHGVRSESLTNGNSYTFNIALNKREFASYNYVRMESVEAEIGGISSTKSGKYYTELRFDGNPFKDRGFKGQPLTFQTPSRLYTYLNQVSNSSHYRDPDSLRSSHSTLIPGSIDPFGDKISDITPFSNWTISLPPTSSNEGLEFDDCPRGVTVRLIFHIYAQLKETTLLTSERMQKAFILRTRGLEGLSFDQKTEIVSTSDILHKMAGKLVTGGWDVLFSMDRKQVNDNLHDQFIDKKGNPNFFRSAKVDGKVFTNALGRQSKTSYSFHFNAPQLKFMLNNSESAQIIFPLDDGNYIQYTRIDKNDDWTLWDKGTLKTADQYSIKALVPFELLQGEVSSKKNVTLNLNKVDGIDLNIGELGPNLTAEISEMLRDGFSKLADHDGYNLYTLGTLDTTNFTLPALTPSKFKLNIYLTKSNREVLQLFIATTGKLQNATDTPLTELYPSLFHSSLIISSKIFFSNILPTSLGDAGVGLKLSAVAPEDKDGAWSSKVTSGKILDHFGDTVVYSSTQYDSLGRPVVRKDYAGVPDQTVTISLTDMTFKPDTLKMFMEHDGIIQPFKYGVTIDTSSINYHNHTLKVNICMGADLSFTVTGSGQNQSLKLAAADTKPLITGNIEPSGACKCNDSDLQTTF